MTLEEVEAATAAAKAQGEKPELDKIKLDDGVPEEFKGKTVAEVVQMSKAAMESLKTSEQRRLELESRPAPVAPVVVESTPEPELTKDQLNELYQKDPMAAIEYMSTQAEKRAVDNLTRRIGPLVLGSSVSAEEAAKLKYPDEFELFGPEIKKFVENAADKSIWAQPKTWDDLVAYVRGQPANFDKLVAHRAGKTAGQRAAEAQAAQAAAAGATVRSTITAPVGAKGAAGLDELELEFAKGLGLTPDEYATWKRKEHAR